MIDAEATTLHFAEDVLKLKLYDWQVRALAPLDECPRRRVKLTLCTPNGAGKSERIVATAALYWLAMFPAGKVVITTKSGLQLDSQVEPAIVAHRAKFPEWKFIQREITTPTGGRCVMFTTDEAGRAEGHHPVGDPSRGPVLIIVDEAKSVPEEIFQALDRCTWAAMIYVSSSGKMAGRFYDSHHDDGLGFTRMSAGLKDCPHITKERIADIERTYGPDSATPNIPLLRSILHGEFMQAESELRFNADGLEALTQMCDVEGAAPRAKTGRLTEQERGGIQWTEDGSGFVWCIEEPIPGCEYVGFCDPMTGEQSEGSKTRDGCGAGIIRKAFTDEAGVMHDDEVVAVLHAPGGVRWANDVMSERLSMLLQWYGDPVCIVEANNSGTEVMRLLLLSGRRLWRREKPNHRIPGKKMIDVVGFQTTAASKNIWIGALATAISQRTLVCRYRPAVDQMRTFILDENGRGAAQQNCHDDFVTGIGLGLFALPSSATRMERPSPIKVWTGNYRGQYFRESEREGLFS